MASIDQGYLDMLRRVKDLALADLLDLRAQFAAALGPQPFDRVRGDRWDKLMFYLNVIEQPWAIDALVQDVQTRYGLTEGGALLAIVRDAATMERRLADAGGPEAVRLAVEARRAQQALRAVERADRELARPPFVIRPAVGWWPAWSQTVQEAAQDAPQWPAAGGPAPDIGSPAQAGSQPTGGASGAMPHAGWPAPPADVAMDSTGRPVGDLVDGSLRPAMPVPAGMVA